MRVLWRAKVLAVGLVVVLSGPLVRGDVSPAQGKEQFWEGKLTLRPGFEIRLVIRASIQKGTDPVATLDSPDEGLSGLKLTSVVIDDSRLAFELKMTDAKFEGKMNDAKTEAKGTWSQRGASLPLTFVKKDKMPPMPKLVGKEQIWEGKIGMGAGLKIRLVLHVQKDRRRRLCGQTRQPRSGGQGDSCQLGHAR